MLRSVRRKRPPYNDAGDNSKRDNNSSSNYLSLGTAGDLCVWFECFVVVEVVVFGVVVLYKQQQWWWSCWCSVGSQSGSDSPTVAIAIVCGRSSRSFSKSSNYSGIIFARKWRNARTSCRVMCQYNNVKTWRKVCSLQFVKRWKSMTNSSTQRSTSTCHEPNKDLSSSQLNRNSWRA